MPEIAILGMRLGLEGSRSDFSSFKTEAMTHRFLACNASAELSFSCCFAGVFRTLFVLRLLHVAVMCLGWFPRPILF